MRVFKGEGIMGNNKLCFFYQIGMVPSWIAVLKLTYRKCPLSSNHGDTVINQQQLTPAKDFLVSTSSSVLLSLPLSNLSDFPCIWVSQSRQTVNLQTFSLQTRLMGLASYIRDKRANPLLSYMPAISNLFPFAKVKGLVEISWCLSASLSARKNWVWGLLSNINSTGMHFQ